MALEHYRNKRDFSQTQEPSGTQKKRQGRLMFVIQKHNASHLHYDFRLEMNGVLKSWAVPKGPTLAPAIKRLAVEVEDHPIEYGSFEGIIPEKQYGAGVVMVWDSGYWECDGDPEEEYKNGKININLFGTKLHGLWKLIKIKSKKIENSKTNWLLMKAKDKYAKTDYDILVEQPLGALTHLSTEEIGSLRSKKEKIPDKKISRKKELNSRDGIDKEIIKLSNAKKKLMPKTLRPQLAYLVNQTPSGNNWIHEIKYDGYRLLCFINNEKIHLITRNGKDWTEHFTCLLHDLGKFKLKNVILDGEAVAVDKKGSISFQELQSKLKESSASELLYYVFDILYCNGYDLTHVPLIERKEFLKKLFETFKLNGNVIYAEFIRGHGEESFQEACKLSLEGLMSKKMNSVYESRRSHTWVKTKCNKRQEFVIGGFTKPKGSREHFGALLVGYYNKKNQLVYCGKVGTGFSSKTLKEYRNKFTNLITKTSPFANTAIVEKQKEVTWLKPEMVAELKFTEFTEDNILRHPAFIGLREDKDAEGVHQEKEIYLHPTAKLHPRKDNILVVGGIKLSHPDKVIYPDYHITKQILAAYYQQVSKWILPYIINRPLSIVRCPDGYGGECFFQKHFSKTHPEHLYPIVIPGDKEKYFYIKNEKGLLSLIQLGALEIHPWGSRIDKVEKPDQITFDLDPGPHISWDTLIESALFIHEQLTIIGLKSFLKTTGGKGFHIVIPISRKFEWPDIKEFSHNFAIRMCELKPRVFISTMNKSKRDGKIFIDYLRNGRGSTSVAAYSTRAKENGSISTPLSWNEIKKIKSADQFAILNILPRLHDIEDPWEEFFKCRQSISKNLLTRL